MVAKPAVQARSKPYRPTKNGREGGWRSVESVRLPPMWPEFDSDSGSFPARRHMWVEFVFGSRLHPKVFSFIKTTAPNSYSTRIKTSDVGSKQNKKKNSHGSPEGPW